MTGMEDMIGEILAVLVAIGAAAVFAPWASPATTMSVDARRAGAFGAGATRTCACRAMRRRRCGVPARGCGACSTSRRRRADRGAAGVRARGRRRRAAARDARAIDPRAAFSTGARRRSRAWHGQIPLWDSQRRALAGVHGRHAVAHRHAVGAAGARDRAVARREEQERALAQRHDVGAGLRARALLDEDELAPREVLPGRLSTVSACSGNTTLAVDVLVQRVVAARPVAQDQRRRAVLARRRGSGRGTTSRSAGNAAGSPSRAAQALATCGQRRVQRGAQPADELRQRVVEVLVAAGAEAVAGHVHGAAEAPVVEAVGELARTRRRVNSGGVSAKPCASSCSRTGAKSKSVVMRRPTPAGTPGVRSAQHGRQRAGVDGVGQVVAIGRLGEDDADDATVGVDAPARPSRRGRTVDGQLERRARRRAPRRAHVTIVRRTRPRAAPRTRAAAQHAHGHRARPRAAAAARSAGARSPGTASTAAGRAARSTRTTRAGPSDRRGPAARRRARGRR